MNTKQLKITLKKSVIGCIPGHVKTLESLGLRRLNQSTIQPNTPSVMGKVVQIHYLLDVQENH